MHKNRIYHCKLQPVTKTGEGGIWRGGEKLKRERMKHFSLLHSFRFSLSGACKRILKWFDLPLPIIKKTKEKKEKPPSSRPESGSRTFHSHFIISSADSTKTNGLLDMAFWSRCQLSLFSFTDRNTRFSGQLFIAVQTHKSLARLISSHGIGFLLFWIFLSGNALFCFYNLKSADFFSPLEGIYF